MDEYLYVTRAQRLWGTVLFLTFSTGRSAVVDLSTILRGPAYEKILNDSEYFEKFVLDSDIGTLVWPDGADIAPETLLEGASLRSDQPVASADTTISAGATDHSHVLPFHGWADNSSLDRLFVRVHRTRVSPLPDINFFVPHTVAHLSAEQLSVSGLGEMAWSDRDDAAFRSLVEPE